MVDLSHSFSDWHCGHSEMKLALVTSLICCWFTGKMIWWPLASMKQS